MSISKKIRFEVFKRDGFKCAYCGQSPPTVILEVDHIDPKSKGGKDDINNLLTACFGCNRGKTNIPLVKTPAQMIENLEILKEKEAQLKEYRAYVKKIESRVNKDIADIDDVYSEAFPGWGFSDNFKQVTLKRFLTLLPKHVIINSLMIAVSKFPNNETKAIPYFCGVCWNKIRGTER